MDLFELQAKITLDTSDYEKGVKGATEKSKGLQKSFEESARYSETLENKLKVLASQHESAKKEVDKLTDAFNKAAKEKGADIKEAQELAEKLKGAENKADGLQKEMDDLTQSTAKSGKEFDGAGSKLSNFADKLKSGLKTAAKVGTAAITAAASGIGVLTKKSIDGYAEYEQLVGGVETLFKNNADTVIKNAERAYKEAGMSQNQYMETVTSFSASLIQSLGGDTAAAAEYAQTAIVDMSDNANKLGTSMESIQYAYQGFAKQNYTINPLSAA